MQQQHNSWSCMCLHRTTCWQGYAAAGGADVVLHAQGCFATIECADILRHSHSADKDLLVMPQVSFYMRKGADLLSKWVGEAEKQLRLLFEEAARNQPAIIFFDEIDGLAPVRGMQSCAGHGIVLLCCVRGSLLLRPLQ
jgi:hypothetical protein